MVTSSDPASNDWVVIDRFPTVVAALDASAIRWPSRSMCFRFPTTVTSFSRSLWLEFIFPKSAKTFEEILEERAEVESRECSPTKTTAGHDSRLREQFVGQRVEKEKNRTFVRKGKKGKI